MFRRRKTTVEAVVQNIVVGKHGPYAVATATGIEGSITFSLDPSVWKGETNPEQGELVHLKKLKNKKAGWRAMHAEPHTPSKEKSAMSNKQLAEKVVQIITQWSQVFKFDKTSDIWKEWVDFSRREWRDLSELMVDGSYQESFGARALFLVLSPDDAIAPFYWKGSQGSPDYLINFQNPVLPNLSQNLVRFGAQLLTAFYLFTKSELSVEDYNGRSLWTAYNNLAIEFMSLLPDQSDETRNLFSLFELNDPTVWWNMDDASGYNPFSRLLRSKGLSETWKRQADEEMRSIIQDELAGRRKPREEHEDALQNYSHSVTGYLYHLDKGTELYSLQLFFDQVRFILRVVPDGYKKSTIHSFHVGEIAEAAQKAGELQLIRDLARFAVAQEEIPYKTDEISLLMEASRDDPKLVQVFQDAIHKRKRQAAENEKYKLDRAASEKSISDQMKN